MNRRVLTFLAFAALAAAGMKTYTVKLLEPAMLGGTQLKAGEYQIQVDGDKAVLRSGKGAVETPVKVETGGSKYRTRPCGWPRAEGNSTLPRSAWGVLQPDW